MRERLAAHAIAFATELRYESAGTVEFLVDGDQVFFLELNARIQVEHPVTEAVAGLDLVELQLRVANGERLTGLEPGTHGHAVEARLYAEDPRTFLPKDGRITRLALPESIRVDAGVAEGDEVGTRYDPMIAKLVAHAADRDAALDLLADALDETVVEGRDDEPPVPPLARRASRIPPRRSCRPGSSSSFRRFPPRPVRCRKAGAGAGGSTFPPPRSWRRSRSRRPRVPAEREERPTGASPRRCPVP